MNIVFSGPSGAGKGTLTEMFLKNSNLKKFDYSSFITGEYLTYNCENLQRKLRRK